MATRGRPPKQPDETKSATLSVPITSGPVFKTKGSRGGFKQSISEEVERRMIESFADDEMRRTLMNCIG